ncbi:MAG TPA: cation diffusion facilitator family transporter [Candidatus Binataceae bacterium]|nr:cation diffusion facilitator family transporter [Candidatus Binataceae bacterium]
MAPTPRGDSHAHHDHRALAGKDRRRLLIVLAIAVAYFATELLAGYLTNSLALLSDAIHMMTDIAAICLSLLTLWISARPASPGKTFGYQRAEILGAVLNGLFLWLLVAFIWVAAVRRISTPEPVSGLGVLVVACIGIVVNSFAAWLTSAGADQHGTGGMAIRGVFVHVVSDLIGTIGVLISGALVYFSGWYEADPLVSVLIGALVLYSSWGLVREGVDILMESVPAHIDLDRLRERMLAVGGTTEVHDLHVWCLTSRQFALCAHCVLAPGADHDLVLSEMHGMLEREFNIRHMTVQLERDSRRGYEPEHF